MNNRKPKFTILICALNEEKNLKSLLSDIKDQINRYLLPVEKIIIVSDSSTDDTDNIVKQLMKDEPRIKLYRNKKRLGKLKSQIQLFKNITTDYVILFDADIRLDKLCLKKLVSAIPINRNILLLGGNPVPKKVDLFNITHLATNFNYLLLQEIKRVQPDSIYSAHGRILCIAKRLYKNIKNIKFSSPGDDQYFYLMSKGLFKYLPDVKVYYNLPSLPMDHLKQSIRFRVAKQIKIFRFTKESCFKIKSPQKIFLKVFFQNPICGIAWIIMYTVSYLMFNLNKSYYLRKYNQKWELSMSTK